jgi:hypothetical protein
MRTLKKILLGFLIFIGVLLVVLIILGINPKPEIINLERRPLSEAEIDKMAREAVDQMSLE